MHKHDRHSQKLTSRPMEYIQAVDARTHQRSIRKEGKYRNKTAVSISSIRLRRSTLSLMLAFPATGAWALDVANQTDWNTAMAAVAAAGSGTTVSINVTANFSLSSSLAALQTSNANVTVNINGGGKTIDGGSAFQGIVVQGANAPTVTIASLAVANTAARGGSGQNGSNGFLSGALSYGSGGGGGGGLGAGGGLLVGGGANVTLAAVTFTGSTAVGGAGGNGGVAQSGAADPVNGGNGGAGGAASINGGASGGGGAGGTGGHTGTQGTVGSAATGLGDGGGGGGGSGTTNSTSYTPNNNGGAGNSGGGNGGQDGDGVTNNNGSQGPGSDGGSGGNGGGARGGAIYVATGGTLNIMDTPISGASATGGAGGSQGTGQGPSNFNGSPGGAGTSTGAGIYLSGVNAGIGVSSGSTTYSNQISGTGITISGTTTALTKTGNGTLALAAANNDFTGRVVINAGALSIAATGNLGNAANDVVIGDGATLAVTGTTTLASGRAITFSGSSSIEVTGSAVATIQGTTANDSSAGSLTKAGTGTLVLSGVGSYTGTTTVSAGTLRLGIAAALPDATALSVSTGATFDLNSFTKSIGALDGGGTMMLGSGSLTTANTGTTTFSGAITGSGALIKQGDGTLILSGASSHTGATTVNAGTLSENGSTSSLVTVNAGAALGGTGSIGGANIASGGVFAPGNSIGTITVNGNVAFASGSIYRVETDAAGNADRINATGSATLSGGTVDVQAAAGTYQAKTLYTILNATGGVTGTFTGVTSNLAFLDPTLSYAANDVILTLSRNDISLGSVAITPNQIALAAAFQRITANNTPEMAQVLTALQGTSAVGARAAFDSVGGASITSLHRAGMLFSIGVGDLLNRRLGAIAVGNGASQPVLLAANDRATDLAPVYAQADISGASGTSQAIYRRGMWMRAFGADQNTDSDGNAAGYGLRGGGLSIGFDSEVRDGLVLGVSVAAGKSNLSVDGNGDSGNSRGKAIAAYGRLAAGPLVLKGIASFAVNDNHMDRNVTVGPISNVASSDFDGRSQALYAEATYNLKLSSYTLQPLVALSYVRLQSDGFTEQGAGVLNLQVAEQTTHSTKSLLGVKTTHEFGSLKLEPRILWSHEFGDVDAPLSAQITGAGVAGAFQISGVQLKRDSLVLGLGASGYVAKNVTLYADVQVDHNERQQNVAAFFGVRGSF